jgi:hypothetical protein
VEQITCALVTDKPIQNRRQVENDGSHPLSLYKSYNKAIGISWRLTTTQLPRFTQMPEPVNALTLQFLAWVSERRRTYEETMEAWKTTCPRHTVWEDSIIETLIEVKSDGSPRHAHVVLTPKGKAVLNNGIVKVPD